MLAPIPRLARLLTAICAAFCLFAPAVVGQAPTTIRVSVASDGTQGNSSSPAPPGISLDGRHAAYYSRASNLVPGDTNGKTDVFVYDTQTGVTTRVSVASDGTQGDDDSFESSLSADGRFVTFISAATNLVPDDTNGVYDAFVHDVQTGMTTRVSVSSNGTQGDGASYYPSLSADGQHVVFASTATNLVPGDTNDRADIFVHDMKTGVTARVSVASDGTQANNVSQGYSSLSADGRYVAFGSLASNFTPGDTNGAHDVFVHDTQTGATALVSRASDSTGGNGFSYIPSLSSDGRYVAFESFASNLVAGDNNGTNDIFIRDLQAGTTTRASVATLGMEGNHASYRPSLCGDGRYVAFHSAASNLVSEDTNGVDDVFIHEVQAGVTIRASVTVDGAQGNGGSGYASLSGDGRFVAFDSDATNLVPGDTNGGSDVFMRGPNPKPSISSVWAWGRNNSGQLGDGSTANRPVPARVFGLAEMNEISAGLYHNLAIVTGGGAWAWGGNANGQLGDGSTSDSYTPIRVVGVTDVSAVSAGAHHSLAVDINGHVWAWGSNSNGQRGDDGTSDSSTPIRLAGITEITTISAGWIHSLALKSDGTVWAWGDNGFGQLGDGSTTNHSTPIPVSGITNGAAVSAGHYHSLLVDTNGSVRAWGWNNYGQLGDGTNIDRHSPSRVAGLSQVEAVSAGSVHSLALKTDGTVWAWGYNDNGQLGDGTTTDRWTPVQVLGLTDVKAVCAGLMHSMAVRKDGTVWTWGRNTEGELGNGSFINVTVPVRSLSNAVLGRAGAYHNLAIACSYLNFSTRPQGGTAGIPLAIQPVLEALQPDGSVEAATAGPVNIAIKSTTGASGAVLKGTTTVPFTGGVATFTDLSIDKPGIGYVLVATAGTLPPVESLPFNVYAPPAHLIFTTQPDFAEAGKPFLQQPVVLARDENNVLIADYNGPVTLAVKAGTGTPGAALTGTATVMAVNGVATFTDLGIDRKGTGYVLEALVGTNMLGESAAFNVSPKAERLVFTAQPGGATDDWPFMSQPVISVVDADGETAALNRGVITLAVKPGTGVEGVVLTGTSTATALHGAAGFAGLNINKIGAGYVLTASSPGLASADSAAFDVVEAPKLLLHQSATDEIEVSIRPAGANIVGATVALSWNGSELKAVQAADILALNGWTVDSSDTTSGVTATLSNPGTNTNGPVLILHLTAQPGFTGHSTTVTLTDLSDLTDDGYNVLPVRPRSLAFIPGGHLSVTRQPVLTTAGEALAGQPAVSMLDGAGNVVTDFTEAVSLAVKPGTGAVGAVLGGTYPVNAVAGVAVFNDLTIDRKGTGYVLVAASGPFSAESLAFDIAPRALRLAFTTQPGNARAGLPIVQQPIIAVQDDEGATASAFTGPIALGIKPGTGYPGAVLAGSATLNAVAGIASFTDVRIGTAAPGYVLTASGQSLTGAESAAFDVTPFTFTLADARDALRWSGGITAIPPGYLERFDIVVNGRVELSDAARVLRKAVGLEPNP